jgi:hypothetical protein
MRVRFARPHYAPGLDWSAYQPLLPDWEIVVGDPTAPGALDGVDVLVAAAVDAELIDAGASASSSRSARAPTASTWRLPRRRVSGSPACPPA